MNDFLNMKMHLITDKINTPILFADKCIDKKRLKMEIFSLASVEKVLKNGIIPIVSESVFPQIKGGKVVYMKYVTVSRKNIVKLK